MCPLTENARENLRVVVAAAYIVTGGVVGLVLFLTGASMLVIAGALAALFAAWSVGWAVVWSWSRRWGVFFWMRRYRVDHGYKGALSSLSPYIRMRELRTDAAALAVIHFYRFEHPVSSMEMARFVRLTQGSAAAGLGDEILPCLRAMYSRKKVRWTPKAESVDGWLSRASKLRADGVELDTVLAYFRQVPAGAALDAMENGIPIDYAVA